MQDYIYEYGDDYYPTTGMHGNTGSHKLQFWTLCTTLYFVHGKTSMQWNQRILQNLLHSSSGTVCLCFAGACCRSHAKHMLHVLPHIMRQFENLLETQTCMLVACQGLHSTSMCVYLCLVWKAAAFYIWHMLCLFSSCQCCGAHVVHVACVLPQMCGSMCGTWVACILLHCT